MLKYIFSVPKYIFCGFQSIFADKASAQPVGALPKKLTCFSWIERKPFEHPAAEPSQLVSEVVRIRIQGKTLLIVLVP